MIHLKTDNFVNIFPVSKNINKNTSKLFYEQNVANIVRQVTDKECYVISGNVDSDGIVIGSLKLSMYGYFIELTNGTELISDQNATSLYIGIRLTNEEPQELNGQVDENGYITSIILSTAECTSSSTEKWLKLLVKDDNTWTIPTENYLKFNLSSIFEVQDIDGKHPLEAIV